MKRLPTTAELQQIADEVSSQLLSLRVIDFDRILASLDVQLWELQQEALAHLGQDDGSYYAGGLAYLQKFREGLELAREAKAKQQPQEKTH